MSKKQTCPNCFSLIGDKTRVKIIRALKKKPSNVNDIAANFSLTQPTISYHLKVLEKARILLSKKKGRETYYFLNKKYPCQKCLIFKIPLKI